MSHARSIATAGASLCRDSRRDSRRDSLGVARAGLAKERSCPPIAVATISLINTVIRITAEFAVGASAA